MVPDGESRMLIGDEEGLADRNGRHVWEAKAASFSRLVPVSPSDPTAGFVAWHINERFDLHDRTGKVMWSVKESVNETAGYESPAGERFVFSSSGYQGHRTQ